MRDMRERGTMVALVLTCACSARPLLPSTAPPPGTTPLPGATPDAPPPGDGTVTQPVRTGTQVPFSCQPMPGTFLFPPPGPDVPGQFSRCASFEVGAATSVAASPDGRLAALMTADGLARVVEIASRRVIAVLASPRAMIDYAAFAPDGSAVVTLARGQREVTLWRAADWTPVWTVSLPGPHYYHLFGGGIAFSPDGSAAVVSPGADAFLLDVAGGAVRATRSTPYGAVLDIGYGWNGRRVVVVEPSLAAHCIHDPNGGNVVILDPGTLSLIAAVQYGEYPEVKGQPQFRASPTDDLVLVPDPDAPGQLAARKLSDGSALPAPALATLPLAFMPDGETALVYDRGALLRVRVADAAVTSVVMLGASGPFAVSADGSLVAFAGKGADLLRVWNSGAGAGGAVQQVCGTDEPASAPVDVSLSGDGARLAIGTPSGVRVLRTTDGATIASLPTPGRPILSPSGERVVIAYRNNQVPVIVSRISDGTRLAKLAQDQWYWGTFAFSPQEDRLYAGGSDYHSSQYAMDVVDLLSDGSSAIESLPQDTVMLGLSNGCPVLYQGPRGIWRSCGASDDPAIASGGGIYDATLTSNAVLSAEGNYIGIGGSSGVTLWRMPPEAALLATIGQRGDDVWKPQERPTAISPDGARVLTGTWVNPACYSGPGYEAHLHDVASGALLDALPPGPGAVDGQLRTLAYGTQLWCAR